MALANQVIADFLKFNYPSFVPVPRMSAYSDEVIVFQCRNCKTALEVKSLERLGISVETYVVALLRRTFDRHIAECDGTLNTVKAPAKNSQPQPGQRKIVLEN